MTLHGRLRTLVAHDALLTILIMLLPLAGCTSSRNKILSAAPSSVSDFGDGSPATAPSPTVAPAPAPAAVPTSQRLLIGLSVEGRPIEMCVFTSGDGSVIPVLVLAAIHGDESTTVELTTQLLALLEQRPLAPDVAAATGGKSVAVIAIANPDGFAAHTRTNARGIDLNRNFAASNFHPSHHYGTRPASEPETQTILKALDDVKPRLIISIHSITRGRECNNFDGPAEPIAIAMSRYNHYRVAGTIGYPTPGSMGSYCGIDRQIPMITLELPHDEPATDAWQQNRDALLAAIREAN